MGFDDGQVEVIAVAHHGLAWSPDGRRLAAGKGAAIRVWNAADWRLERTLEGHAKWVTVVAWAPGGELLASGSSDCTVRVWEAATGACIAVAQLLSTIVALRFTADGRGVQAADDGTATANRPIPYELALCRP
jgi:WD40 repeat protein